MILNRYYKIIYLNIKYMKPYKPKQLPLEKINWEKFVHLIGGANAEVARFDGLLQSMPNPAVLLSPLTTQEAVLSSKIEGTKATLQEVLEYEAQPKKETEKYHDIQEILNYRRATSHAVKNMDKLSLSVRLIKEVHNILLDSVRGQSKDRGNFRRVQVHIGKSNKIEEATYIPPSAQNLPELMSNLEKYIHSGEKDALVQLAIVHAQFEMIHPFMDGNGRVGRIIMPLFLYHKKVLTSPMFYLSAYFEAHREEYYKRLLYVSKENDWEAWIEYFLEGVMVQSRKNIEKAKAIHSLYDVKKDRISELTRSRYSIKALDYLFCFPIFTSTQFIKDSGIPRRTAIRIMNELSRGQVTKVIAKGSGKSPSTYIFPKLIKIVG
jgi:Fic family protein